jgi:hypothetical protein
MSGEKKRSMKFFSVPLAESICMNIYERRKRDGNEAYLIKFEFADRRYLL